MIPKRLVSMAMSSWCSNPQSAHQLVGWKGCRGSRKCEGVVLVGVFGFKWPMRIEDLLVGQSAFSPSNQSLRLYL